MPNHQVKLSTLLEEYATIAEKVAQAHENGENCTEYEPWLQTYVDAILFIKAS